MSITLLCNMRLAANAFNLLSRGIRSTRKMMKKLRYFQLWFQCVDVSLRCNRLKNEGKQPLPTLQVTCELVEERITWPCDPFFDPNLETSERKLTNRQELQLCSWFQTLYLHIISNFDRLDHTTSPLVATRLPSKPWTSPTYC